MLTPQKDMNMRITNNRLGQAAIIFILTSGSCMAETDIYRWVDDAGVVHFAEQPPMNIKSEKVDTRAIITETPEATADTVTDTASYEETSVQPATADPISPAQQVREERATAREVAAAKKAEIEENCINADHIVSKLEPTPNVLVTDAAGKVSRMDDDVRLKKLSEAQDYAKANCNQ